VSALQRLFFPGPPHSTRKIEFPKFNGTGDLMDWLNRSDRYFTLCGTPANQRV
jgi:hypothetical protein